MALAQIGLGRRSKTPTLMLRLTVAVLVELAVTVSAGAQTQAAELSARFAPALEAAHHPAAAPIAGRIAAVDRCS